MHLRLVVIFCFVLFEVKSDTVFGDIEDFFKSFLENTSVDLNNTNTGANETYKELIEAPNITINYFEAEDDGVIDIDGFFNDAVELFKKQLDNLHLSHGETSNGNNYNGTEVFINTFIVNDNNIEKTNEDFNDTSSSVNNVKADLAINNELKDIPLKVNIDSIFNERNGQTDKNVTKSGVEIKIESVLNSVTKNPIENEIDSIDELPVYYDSNEENSTDYPIIDYVELYKDTTNEYVEYNPTEIPTSTEIIINEENINESENSLENTLVLGDERPENSVVNYDSVCNSELKEAKASSIFPWIAAIFIKNATNEQFDYYCDGAILSRNVILTAARCVLSPDAPVNPDNVIVIAGKRSLQAAGGNETVARVKYITVHENFTLTGDVDNDLSILVLEQQLEFSSYIYSACFGDSDNNIKDSITTSWKITGELTPIYFDQTKYETCKRISKSNNTFCATYGNDVALCPSYGGVYAAKQTDSSWHIHGIRTGDPTQRGVCFDKDVTYTNITNYLHWIRAIIALNKT